MNGPNCRTAIDVQDILAHRLEDDSKQKFQTQLTEEKWKYEAQQNQLSTENERFEEEKRREKDGFSAQLEAQEKVGSKETEEKLKRKIAEEQDEQFNALQKEFNEMTEQMIIQNRAIVEIEQLKREKGELKELAKVEAQKELNEQLEQEKNKIRKSEEDKKMNYVLRKCKNSSKIKND